MVHMNDAMSQGICPECEIGPFTRNNYFTGKLLVEADFTDEQRYHREKLRHHNQRLHGWGVVCGLKVKQHENPACRDRFIRIEPGTAIDCCGHEIVVREQEPFDFTQVDKIKELYTNNDTDSHTLQVCISYKECPTEEIPVLYDECGCDDTRCAPNRILESYDINVVVDPKPDTEELQMPRQQWDNTVTLAHASRVALHDATHTMYAMVENTIFKVSTENNAIELPSLALLANGVELAISNNGTRLYVVTEPSDSSTTLQLFIYDATSLGSPPINNKPINLDGSVIDGEVYLAIAPTPDNRLFALVPQTGKVSVWATDIDTSANPVDPTPVNLQGTDLAGLVTSSDGKYAYTTDAANHTIHILDVAGMKATPSPITVSPAASPSALAIVSSTGSDLLAVADQTNMQLYLVDPNLTSPASFRPVPLTYNPLDLVASPGGHWVYVLVQDGTKTSYVRAVNVRQVLMAPTGYPVQPTEAIKVGNDSQRLVLSKSGLHMYVPYVGDLKSANDGGVAILSVTEQACDDLLWSQLDECPPCDIANCVVLATIENYRINNKIEDQTDPPAIPEDDANAKISHIDNRKGRRLLPNTQTLTEVLECVMENGLGGVGVQGPPGKPGDPGQPGDPGPGFEKGLVGINALSWQHDTQGNKLLLIELDRIPEDYPNPYPCIAIGFNGEVDKSSITSPYSRFESPYVFEVLVDSGILGSLESQSSSHKEETQKPSGLSCRCIVQGWMVPVSTTLKGDLITGVKQVNDHANGVAFVFDKGRTSIGQAINKIAVGKISLSLELLVRLRGDFVLDAKPLVDTNHNIISGFPQFYKSRAIDAEFVRHELPTGNRLPGAPGGPFGLQGGLFESWFTLSTVTIIQPTSPHINVNVADRNTLLGIEGIGPGTADNILRARAEKPFVDLQDLRSRVSISGPNWARMSDKITMEG